jgi:transposase-like protein
MSNSFKKVVACLLAVLMVMFSVPFTALADGPDTTVYTPDIQLQFGTLFDLNETTEEWVDNFANGPIETAGRGAEPDLSASALGGPILKATTSLDKTNAKLTVKGLTIEAADTENYDNNDLTPLDEDYNLQAGDAFTVTVRMDNVSSVYVATAEISYSGNIEPLYYTTNGKTGKNYAGAMGTADQVETDGAEWGKSAFPDGDPQSLYEGINSDEIGSELRTDYNGENYMYAEVLGPEDADWSEVSDSSALTKEDGTFGNDYAGKSVMATFTFVLKEDLDADHPIYFWVHNGSADGHGLADDGSDAFTGFTEGNYMPVHYNSDSAFGTTYVTNKFESIENQYNGTENFGSKKMTFMGVNENVQSSEPTCEHTNTTTTYENVVPSTCTVAGSRDVVVTCDDCGEEISRTKEDLPLAAHDYQAVVTPPTCTEQGYTTYSCKNCTDSYTSDYTDPTGHKMTKTDAVAATCTTKGTEAYWTCSTCHKMFSDENGTNEITEIVEIPAKNHDWGDPKSVDWDSLDTATGSVKVNYVCGNDDTHTKQETVTAAMDITQQQTEDDPELTKFTVTVGNFTDNKTVETKAAAGHTTHTYTVPVRLDWVGDTTTAKATFKCSKCEETVQYDATVTPVTKTPATCTEAAVWTYTAHYDGFTDISKDVTVGSPAGHTLEKTNAVPATCTTAGTEAYWTCSVCHKMFSDADAQNEIENPVAIPASGHVWGEWTQTTAPTASTKGVETRECSNCHEKETRDVDPLGVNITVAEYFVGEVTINGKEINNKAENVPFGTSYTLEVTDAKDYFKGWEMNGKIISTETTYKTTAYADVTVTPVFEVPDANLITVVFFDKFGNEVKAYNNMSIADYQAAIAADGIPTAQSYPSQKFVEWDTDDDTILGLTESKTIWAIYQKVESVTKYTVTVLDAEGADITATALDAAGFTNGEIPYDTKVTVTNDNAKGWALDTADGAVLSTSDTYSFFVGADITLVMLTDVEAEPTTTIVGSNRLAEPTTYKRYNIVATRNVPDGYTLLDYGFVYGKNMTKDDLVLENEGNKGSRDDSGNVKVTRAGTKNSTSNEFALNYGIKSAGNTVCARSFIAVQKGTDVRVIYSDLFTVES